MSIWPRQFDPGGADRFFVVFSDIEMGAGGSADDFPHSDFLAELLLSYNDPPFADIDGDVIFNGDTFDLLKTSYLDGHPHNITADVAIGKLSRVAAAHPQFFTALREFLRHGGARRRAHFVVGNHDFEVLFPEVQGLIRSLCGGADNIEFPGFELDIGRVHIEHGSQADALFRMKPAEAFVEHNGRKLLNIPWGSIALLDVMMPLQHLLCFHDRLVPRNAVAALLPDVRELVLEMFWRYWTRDYWKGFFGASDPIKRVTWTMLKEIGARMVSKDADVSVGDYAQRMHDNEAIDLYLVGHLHRPAWTTFGNRKTLQTGTLRNEYMVLDGGKRLEPMPRVFAEVYMRGDVPVRSHLVEVSGPPAPAGYIPESIFDVVPKIRELLAPAEEHQKEQAAQQAQEAHEARERRKKVS